MILLLVLAIFTEAYSVEGESKKKSKAPPTFAVGLFIRSQKAIDDSKVLLGDLASCDWLKGEGKKGKTKIFLFHVEPLRDGAQLVPDELVSMTEFIESKDYIMKDEEGRKVKTQTYHAWERHDFWANRVFNIPEVEPLEYLMRLEPGGSYKCNEFSESPFVFMQKGKGAYGYYKYHNVNPAGNAEDINAHVRKYIKRMNITMPKLEVDLTNIESKKMPAFDPSFEILYVPFFRNPKVQNFIKYLESADSIRGHTYGDGIARFYQIFLHFTGKRSQLVCFTKEVHWTYGTDHMGDFPAWCHIPTGDFSQLSVLHKKMVEDRETRSFVTFAQAPNTMMGSEPRIHRSRGGVKHKQKVLQQQHRAKTHFR